MKITHENQSNNRLQNWALRILVAIMLIIIGYKSPSVWLSISATIWAGYFISFFTSPLLIAASQNTTYAKMAKRTLSVLGNLATAALISAPIVIFIWYRVTYFSSH